MIDEHFTAISWKLHLAETRSQSRAGELPSNKQVCLSPVEEFATITFNSIPSVIKVLAPFNRLLSSKEFDSCFLFVF